MSEQSKSQLSLTHSKSMHLPNCKHRGVLQLAQRVSLAEIEENDASYNSPP